MASEESKRNRILEYSFNKFTSEGAGHVTMDDIARGLGIGKGTLYKYFPSKEELLLDTIDFISQRVELYIEGLLNDDKMNPIEKIDSLIKFVGKRLSKINPPAIANLERCFPDAYQKVIEVRQRIIMKNIQRLFEEGKKSGHINPNMDAYLVTNILVGAANHITDAKILSTLNYSLDNVFGTITSTILKGCLTEEGRKAAFREE